jgi:thiol:disulfide interchange protein DsbD
MAGTLLLGAILAVLFPAIFPTGDQPVALPSALAQSANDTAAQPQFRVLGPVPAGEVSSNGASTEHVRATLLSEESALIPGTTSYLGIRLEMKEGWHTYWENPGDSGLATQIEWTLPEGVTAGPIEWPVPEAIPVGPLVNYGYEGDILLLVPVTANAGLATGQSVSLRAKVDWLVCHDVCIPEGSTLELLLPVAAAPQAGSANKELFERARTQLPRPSPYEVQIAAADGEVTMQFRGPPLRKDILSEIRFFPRPNDIFDFAAPQAVTLTEDGFTLRIRQLVAAPIEAPVPGVLVVSEKLDQGVTRQAFSLTASPMDGKAAEANETIGTEEAEVGMWRALLFAFLGGLILNLMPCVFPVLFVKALSFVSHADLRQRDRIAHAAAYAAGVLVTFGILSAALIALKLGGRQIGWGFQLQDPVVLALLAWLILALGFSLSGFFEFGGRVMGVGSRLAALQGHSGSFFTGALAVIVATPCTAPFMGAAMGYALTQPPLLAFLVFEMLALGLATPFVLVSVIPGIASLLPKPGNWMVRLRQLLAFPLYATVVWLLWVLAIAAGPLAVAVGLGGIVVIAFVVWLASLQPRTSGGQFLRNLSALVFLLGVLGLGISVLRQQGQAGKAAGEFQGAADSLQRDAYSDEKLAKLRQSDRPIFVNFTAAWCITCLVNERAVLGTEATRRLFEENQVAYLVGDWTREDPKITRALERFGRSGVPLYVVYRPGQDEPVVLPQILTFTAVREALEK